MFYPKEVFSINESKTAVAKNEYENKQKIWYQKALELYPDYYKKSLKERAGLRKIIDDSIGFSI